MSFLVFLLLQLNAQHEEEEDNDVFKRIIIIKFFAAT